MSDIDIWVMALPNGVAKPWIDAIEEGNSKSLIVDLSADYRFHPDWTYGLPELIERSKIAKANRISNPGCYAVSVFMTKPLFWAGFMLIQSHSDSCADRDRSSASAYRQQQLAHNIWCLGRYPRAWTFPNVHILHTSSNY